MDLVLSAGISINNNTLFLFINSKITLVCVMHAKAQEWRTQGDLRTRKTKAERLRWMGAWSQLCQVGETHQICSVNLLTLEVIWLALCFSVLLKTMVCGVVSLQC